MDKIAIISDVNAGLDYLGKDTHIPVLRSVINFGEDHYIDGIEIKADEFYKMVQEKLKSGIIPSTSAPTVGEAMELLDRLVQEGYTDVIMYSISFKLSSIGSMVENLQKDYEGKIRIHVVDTKTAAFMQGYLAVVAKEMADQGCSVDQIIARSKELIKDSHAYFVVDDLRFLVKNGRLSSAKGFFAGLLRIKPVLEMTKDGRIDTFEKIKTLSKAIERIKQLFIKETEQAKKLYIMIFHTCREEDAKKLKEAFKDIIPCEATIDIHMITPAVGAHIGCGILGFGYYILEKK